MFPQLPQRLFATARLDHTFEAALFLQRFGAVPSTSGQFL